MSTSIPTIAAQLSTLQVMTVGQLRTSYRDLFGEDTNSHNRDFLYKRIAWRLQEQAFGGLSARTKDRLAGLVDESLIRVRPPHTFRPGVDAGQLAPAAVGAPTGKILSRCYKGRQIEVSVLDNGFLYDGKLYASLTAVSNAITGTHCSGRAFFGLTGKGA